MAKYIKIEDIPLPGIQTIVPRRRWTDEERAWKNDKGVVVGRCERYEDMSVNTGDLMIEMLSHPWDHGTNQAGQTTHTPRAIAVDRIRSVLKPLEYLDDDEDGACDLPIGSYAVLEDSWYNLIMEQALTWPWSSQVMTLKAFKRIDAMIQSWQDASDKYPLALVEQIETKMRTLPGDDGFDPKADQQWPHDHDDNYDEFLSRSGASRATADERIQAKIAELPSGVQESTRRQINKNGKKTRDEIGATV